MKNCGIQVTFYPSLFAIKRFSGPKTEQFGGRPVRGALSNILNCFLKSCCSMGSDGSETYLALEN